MPLAGRRKRERAKDKDVRQVRDGETGEASKRAKRIAKGGTSTASPSFYEENVCKKRRSLRLLLQCSLHFLSCFFPSVFAEQAGDPHI